MKLLNRTFASAALAAALGGCSLGGMLGGSKPPATLQTLTAQAPDPGPSVRTVNAGQAVTIMTPTVPK